MSSNLKRRKGMKKKLCKIGRKLSKTANKEYKKLSRVVRLGEKYSTHMYSDYDGYLERLATAHDNWEKADMEFKQHFLSCPVCGSGV
jgi:hypothetical protein